MTENNEQQEGKSKKLTLGGPKLKLNKPVALTRSNTTSSGAVVVEVKRGKAQTAEYNLPTEDKSEVSSDFEMDRKILALQNSDADKKDAKQVMSSLTRLAEMNRPKEKEVAHVEINEMTSEAGQETIAPDNTGQDVVGPAPGVAFDGDKKDADRAGRQDRAVVKQIPIVKETVIEEKKAEEGKAAPAKAKVAEIKKLKKSDIIHMLDEGYAGKSRSLASIKRAQEKERRKASLGKKQDKVYREVIIPEIITVGELANRMSERAADVVKELMKLGVVANISQDIDADIAELVATTLGHTPKRVQESDVENILTEESDAEEDLLPRAPVVTVMGHVDHGKTSLLDALRLTDIVAKEAGGITQHIGAYVVTLPGKGTITFIDTPGHAAFTEMRTRGAKITDIVVLVVAADEGIKTQTIEAISHAKAAGVPIIVAVNKIDKPGANLDKVKNELLQHELISEDLGGETIIVPVSALKKINLDKLEEAILLVAEMLELRSNPKGNALGAVIETRIDKGQGVVTSVLVQRGTLKKGDLIVAGMTYGRIRRMNNDKGKAVNEAGPSIAVEVHGLNTPPFAGDVFNVVQSEKQARDITDYRLRQSKKAKILEPKTALSELFMRASGGSVKELPLIIKGDVHGSIEAIASSLNKILSEEVKLRILHSAVGGITESDVTLAKASRAIIIGFNVRANTAAASEADANNIDIRYYSIIYNLIDDIKAVMSGMLSPIIRENYIGSVAIREVFNVTKVGKVAGSYVTKGLVRRGAGVRLLRDNIVIYEGKLKTLKRFKEDVKEVREGYECGIAFENYENISVGDVVEVFEIVEEKQQL